jgi:hypothetical protein
MHKQTHKLASLAGDAAAVIARSPSLAEAARRLGVNRSTVHRWIASGKMLRPEKSRRQPAASAIPRQSPGSWGEWARQTFDLSVCEQALVELGEQALMLAQDQAETPAVRLSAIGRFQQLTRQLAFEESIDGKEEEATTAPAGTWPRRVVG